MTKLSGTVTAPAGLSGHLATAGALTGQAGSGAGGGGYQIGPGLKVEEDNTRPVTSAAVYTELGNVEALLANI